MSLTLDSGALIAASKGSARMWALIIAANDAGMRITIPAVVLAQVWRKNDARLARLINGCVIESFGHREAVAVGQLLGQRNKKDIVDGAVVVSALSRGDQIITSDREDIESLLGESLKIENEKDRVIDI